MLSEGSQASNGAARRTQREPALERPEAAALPQTSMRVTKRNGQREPVDANKIVRAVSRCSAGPTEVDAHRVATKTIRGLFDRAATRRLDPPSIQTAAALIAHDP